MLACHGAGEILRQRRVCWHCLQGRLQSFCRVVKEGKGKECGIMEDGGGGDEGVKRTPPKKARMSNR